MTTGKRNAGDRDPFLDKKEEMIALLESDPVRGFEALKALAARSVLAMDILGWYYLHGKGTTRDMEAAERCFRRAAEQGSAAALGHLGYCHQIRKEYARATDCYAQAALMGDPEAQKFCKALKGEWGLRAANIFAKTDAVRAFAAYRNLAEDGSVMAMIKLAQAYDFGIGTDQDPDEAEHWYQRAFESGSGKDKGDAAYYLGRNVEERGDYTKARELYQTGIDLGSPRAMHRMGVLYGKGRGVEKDPKKARSFYEQGARLGSLYALRALAHQDLSGRFGPINFLRGIPRMLRLFWGFRSTTSKWGDRWVHGSVVDSPLIAAKKQKP